MYAWIVYACAMALLPLFFGRFGLGKQGILAAFMFTGFCSTYIFSDNQSKKPEMPHII